MVSHINSCSNMMESSSIENGIALTGRGILIYRFALNDSTQFNWLHVAM